MSIVGAVSPPGGDFSDPVTSATLGIVQVKDLIENGAEIVVADPDPVGSDRSIRMIVRLHIFFSV